MSNDYVIQFKDGTYFTYRYYRPTHNLDAAMRCDWEEACRYCEYLRSSGRECGPVRTDDKETMLTIEQITAALRDVDELLHIERGKYLYKAKGYLLDAIGALSQHEALRKLSEDEE